MTTPTRVADVTQIGAYRVLDRLGEGGMGAVYLCEHTLLGRRAAIKVLHPMFSARPDIVERFFNEARATTSIADPGIVQVFDFGFHDGTAYIVMELLEGETLLARMKRLRRMPEAELLRLVRQISLSVHAAHSRGVVHRDLKPDNIFIVPDPEAVGGERTKVLDFGIAKLVDNTNANQHTQTGLVLGTPSYMSPEQCRGAGQVDHRSDIYSLGCVMFRCVTGHQVFEGQGSGDLIAAHLREPPRAPSSVYPVRSEIDAIVLRCLQKDPNARYQTMLELATDVDELLRAISVPPDTRISQLTTLPPPSPVPVMIPTGETVLPASNPTTLSSAVSMRQPEAAGRRWPLIAMIAVLLVGGGIATVVATSGGGKSTESSAAPANAPAPPPATSTESAPAIASPAAPPTEAKPAEAKSAEVKSAEVKPAEAKPAEAKPAEVVKPAEKLTTKPTTKKSTTKKSTTKKNSSLYDDR